MIGTSWGGSPHYNTQWDSSMTMKSMSIFFFTNSLSCSAQNYPLFTLYLKGEKNIFEREKIKV